MESQVLWLSVGSVLSFISDVRWVSPRSLSLPKLHATSRRLRGHLLPERAGHEDAQSPGEEYCLY